MTVRRSPLALAVPHEQGPTRRGRSCAVLCAVNNWDVSRVESMGYMFYSCGKFNYTLAGWDVSANTNFAKMFGHARKFNQVCLQSGCPATGCWLQRPRPTDWL